ncbi:hypothetical protein [Flagellimonas sp. CMM7]|uniref:hypothetical protein n=1 Tax=Flagellimonas sp. CMM7 TaxID=2654676 RepID=UPI0013D66255|nr:hypothetical protein [Flagellimonas sp. CMM7]UII80008.1 hypothetical protein LV704_00455 [Flagellimonas sp. CMM7]
MLDRGEVKRTLTRFGRDVQVASRTNLIGKNATKKLANSLDFEVDVFKNSFSFSFFMEKYGEFLDKGVSGTETKYNTKFAYSNKMPPTSAFDKWSVIRGLAERDDKGRFISRESLKFALAVHKYKHGQKPTLFFTRPFEQYYKELPEELIEAYGLDAENLMETTLK